MRKGRIKGALIAAALVLGLAASQMSPAMAADGNKEEQKAAVETVQGADAALTVSEETDENEVTVSAVGETDENAEAASELTGMVENEDPAMTLSAEAADIMAEADGVDTETTGEDTAEPVVQTGEGTAASDEESHNTAVLSGSTDESSAVSTPSPAEDAGDGTESEKATVSISEGAGAESAVKESHEAAAEENVAEAVEEPDSSAEVQEKAEGEEEHVDISQENTDDAMSEKDVPMSVHTETAEETPTVTPTVTPTPDVDLEETKTPVKLAKPVLSSIRNVTAGIKVVWKKVDGAVTYQVYRKEADKGWKKLCDTKKLTVIDKKAAAGTTYSYTVRCLKVGTSCKASGYDKTGLTTCRLTEPVLKIGNSAAGIKISWGAVQGASKYYVYRRNEAGAWTRIAVSSELSYIDQSVSSGNKFCYTVRAVGKDSRGKTARSSYPADGVTRLFLARPEVSATVKADQVTVTWKVVTGATRYQVLRRKPGGSWEKLAVVKNLSYTDKGLKAGETWQYSVRCKKPVYSAYNTKTEKITILPAPTMNNLLYADGVLTVSWRKVEGAVGYRVFRKPSGGKWTKVGDTRKLSMKDKKTPKGVKVYYRVKAIAKCGMGIPMDSSKNIKILEWNSKWTYAGNAAIYSGNPVLYQAPKEVRKKIVVCINAGHGTKGGTSVKTLCHPDGSAKVTGGTTSEGAITAYAVSTGTDMADGSSEASNNLKVALLTRDVLLAAGYDVLMIREGSDIQLDNIARTVFANKYADCHIAIHYDGTTSDKGAFFMSVPDVKSYRNMEPVKSNWQEHNALGKAVIAGLKAVDVKIWASGEMEMDLTQTSYSMVPSIDLEVGDEASPLTDDARTKLAAGILVGLDKYFKQ